MADSRRKLKSVEHLEVQSDGFLTERLGGMRFSDVGWIKKKLDFANFCVTLCP
jgi:hypothetical protein